MRSEDVKQQYTREVSRARFLASAGAAGAGLLTLSGGRLHRDVQGARYQAQEDYFPPSGLGRGWERGMRCIRGRQKCEPVRLQLLDHGHH